MATNVNNETGLIGITPKYKFHDQVTINTGDTIQDVTWLDCEYLAKFKKNSLGPMIVRPDYIYEDTSGSLARNGVTIVGVTTENTLARVTDPEVLRILLANISHTLDNQIRLSEVASGSIGAAWFAGNTKIEVFDCPRGYSVAASAFNGCTGLREVFIQRNVSLGNSAFNGCNRVDCYHFLDTNVGSFGTTVFAGLSGSCYLYVPNEAVVNYCKVTNLGSYITRIRGHIKGWHLICADGSYKYNLRDCYDTATNISFRLEGTYVTNLALSVDPETNEATVTVTGMLPDTDENAQLYYEFDYRNHHFSGYVPLHLKTDAAEIIEFEDPEVKRICVANWGGIYRMTLDGYEGELTKEQAAKVSSIGTTFRSNKVIKYFNEFKYFTKITSFNTNGYAVNGEFASCSSLIEIDLTNIVHLSCSCFQDCVSLKYLHNLRRSICFQTSGSGPIYGCSSLEGELDMTDGHFGVPGNYNEVLSMQAFRGTGWTTIHLPKTTLRITANYVFMSAPRLTSLIIAADHLVTITASNALGSLSSSCKVYVPNDLVISYRKASYWSAIYTRIFPIIDGPSIIHGDGTYSFIPNTPFDGFTDIEWTLEENDYLSLTTEQDGSATIIASGMTSETDVTVRLEYSFIHNGNSFTGAINIPVAYQEIIQFEDEEVKRICVNNWGGIYGSAVKIPGVPGELTMEQAGSVSSIGTTSDYSGDSPFTNNTAITSFKELKYFTSLQTLCRNFVAGCSSLKEIQIPSSVTKISYNAFMPAPNLTKIYFYPSIAPSCMTSNNNNFPFGLTYNTTSCTGHLTKTNGTNELHVPIGATGYSQGAYLSPLQNAQYCGFTIYYDL